MGTGNDFFDKTVKAEVTDPRQPAGSGGAVPTHDQEVIEILGKVLHELKAIHWHLATITENDPDQIRRDI